ncbi:MAG: hypothetical protein ACRD0S_09910, partial [Acidimicrobiales bacterium]
IWPGELTLLSARSFSIFFGSQSLAAAVVLAVVLGVGYGVSRGGGPGGGGGGGDPRPGGRGRWWLVASIAVLLGLGVITAPVWVGSGPDIPPRSIADLEFTTEAQETCDRLLPPLREKRPEAREATGTEEEFATRIDEAADDLAGVAAALREIPVASTRGDAVEVDNWLDDWDAYIGVGRRYADRTRAHEKDAGTDTRAEAAPLERRIFVFARANDMPACVL